jgi:Holliday junction resolvase
MKEKTFENKIKEYIKERGGYYVKYFGCGFSTAGTPDLLCCINGKFVAIEVKGDGGKPTELQKHKIESIQKAGGIALVVYPADFDNLKTLINNLSKM